MWIGDESEKHWYLRTHVDDLVYNPKNPATVGEFVVQCVVLLTVVYGPGF